MIIAIAIVLLLLGAASLKRCRAAEKSGATPPARTYVRYFVCASICLTLFLLRIAGSFIGIHAKYEIILQSLLRDLVQEFIACAAMLILLAIVWLTTKIRDGRIFRAVLGVWIAGWIGFAGWLVWDAVKYGREVVPRMIRHLQSCRKLIHDGKRKELAEFLSNTPTYNRRAWNAAFEAKFPEAGGEK